MPVIKIETNIEAPIERVFDLARSIDLHTRSTSRTEEKAVGGRLSGLIKLDETVTWEAKHLGIRQRLTSKIVLYERPNHFRDSMQQGAFARLDHDHFFEKAGSVTKMHDVFDYDSPFGIFGNLVDFIFLESYMKRFLVERNEMIKAAAEGDGWVEFLTPLALSEN